MYVFLISSDNVAMDVVLQRHRSKMLPVDKNYHRLIIRRKFVWKDTI